MFPDEREQRLTGLRLSRRGRLGVGGVEGFVAHRFNTVSQTHPALGPIRPVGKDEPNDEHEGSALFLDREGRWSCSELISATLSL